jgi:hypothetical protein
MHLLEHLDAVGARRQLPPPLGHLQPALDAGAQVGLAPRLEDVLVRVPAIAAIITGVEGSKWPNVEAIVHPDFLLSLQRQPEASGRLG